MFGRGAEEGAVTGSEHLVLIYFDSKNQRSINIILGFPNWGLLFLFDDKSPRFVGIAVCRSGVASESGGWGRGRGLGSSIQHCVSHFKWL